MLRTPTSDPLTAVLRSYQRGEIPYAELLRRVSRMLAFGMSPALLLDAFRRSEQVEPLPEYARAAVLDLLSVAPFEAPTIVLEEPTGGHISESHAPLAAVGDELLGRFRLLKLIGIGGMSQVFKAIDMRRDAEFGPAPFVAVKVLDRPFPGETADFAEFQRSLQPIQALEHPHIVRLFGCEKDGETVFMILEYVGGRSLFATLASRNAALALDAGARRLIIAGVADALAYAHQHQVVHGDLKPGNVLIGERSQVKLTDFGTARWTGDWHRIADQATANVELGNPGIPAAALTPRYASPQLLARQTPTAADDVYALGCVAYELLTGRHPFDDGLAENAADFAPPPRAELSTAEYAAIVSALRAERYMRPTVEQFQRELRAGELPHAHDAAAASAAENTADHRETRIGWSLVAAALLVSVVIVFWPRLHLRDATTPNTARPSTAPARVDIVSAPTTAAPRAPGTEIRDCATCPVTVVIPAGRFTQGRSGAADEAFSGAPWPFEIPAHAVVIARPIAMSRSDITVGEFAEFIAATKRTVQGCATYDGRWQHRAAASWRQPGFAQSARHPVTCTSWQDAVAYAAWLSQKTAATYRLPSAAEWEYATRAGATSIQPWAPTGTDACAHANVADQSAERFYPGWKVFGCDDRYVHTAPVGSFQRNAFGLDDMLGNVFQWTADCWHANYSGAPADGSARMDGDCTQRELRGGSWFSSPAYVTATYRNHFAADYRTSSVGFRLVRELPP